MADIRHRVGIDTPPTRVYEALSTVEGLSGWWTRHIEGDSAVGGSLRFFFGSPEPSAVMEVTELTPDANVTWCCTEGPDEWVGTTFAFDLSESGGETTVLFTNAGWDEPVEFLHHCSTKWAYFLLELKSGLEGGKAHPFPDDAKISSWG
jgi:uncharacterized protein YndB with AHSA1/START domain